MKNLLAILALLSASLAYAEDMHTYLKETREMVRAGRNDEALKRYIWFHNHALEHEPAMYGVRLSFALRDWKELGEQYPPAMEALIEMRDSKTRLLLTGKNSRELFHDVAAINRTLGEPGKTVSLFEQIDGKQPQAAKSYWRVAKDAVINAKRYDLARKYIGNPVEEFARVKARYDHNTRLYNDHKIGRANFKAYNENNLVEESLQLIEIAKAHGNMQAALEIQAKALAVLDDPRLKSATASETKGETKSGGADNPAKP